MNDVRINQPPRALPRKQEVAEGTPFAFERLLQGQEC